jgi:hypothetical protein
MLSKLPASLHVQWVDQCVSNDSTSSTRDGIAPWGQHLGFRLSSHHSSGG